VREKMLMGVAALLTGILGTCLYYLPLVSAPEPSGTTADHPGVPASAVRSALPDRVHTPTAVDGLLNTPPPAGGKPRADVVPASAPGAAFAFDFTRLSDPAYETDPDLVRWAAGYGLTTPCLLAQVRLRTAREPVGDACDIASWIARHDRLYVLPGTYEEVCRPQGAEVICRTERVAAHPFETFGNHELESLALSFPEAAVLLARRSNDPAVSERYYEQAVALSGRPGPLLEWMGQTGLGGLEFRGGHLDVGKATLGYEIYLVMTAFDHGAHAADGYADALIDAGVELAPIRQRASERLERLHRLRMSLLGSGWEE